MSSVSRPAPTAIGSASVTPASSPTSSKRSGSGPWICSAAARSSGNISRVSSSGTFAIASSEATAASSEATAASFSAASSIFLVAARWRPGRIASAMPCNRPPTPAPRPNDSPVPVNVPCSGSYTPRDIRF